MNYRLLTREHGKSWVSDEYANTHAWVCWELMYSSLTTYPDNTPKYELLLLPENPTSCYEIDQIAGNLKENWWQDKLLEPPAYNEVAIPAAKDKLFDHDCIKFESLFQPQLEGHLKEYFDDEQLVTSFVQVVGHVQIQEWGNCLNSFHIVEPAIHSADKLDI